MNRELIKDYLQRAEMSDIQAEALSQIFAEMATKSDLLLLEERVDKRFLSFDKRLSVMEANLTGQMAQLRTELTGQMSQLRSDLTGEMAQMRADLTWRIVALIVLFGTVITIINTLVG